jgi:molybdopterin-guanine dinucleotide biosynthesis protein A
MSGNSAVTTVILAGGQGSRMGGDKGLKPLHGRPLVAWVLGALRPQGTQIVLSANDNVPAYASLGCPVIKDTVPGYAGPLAGVLAAMQYASARGAGSEWVASVPCDTPHLPGNLIARLLAAAAEADAAVAVAAGSRHPTVAIYRTRVRPRLEHYLAQGGRRVGEWLRLLDAHEAVFEDAAAFININSPEELAAANRARP